MKKYLFSELIEEITELNTELLYGLDDIVGVTIEKGLIPTIANLTKTELNKFYIVKPDTRQTCHNGTITLTETF